LLLLFSFLPPFSLATLHFLAFLSPTSCCPFWFLWISVFPPYSIFILVLPYVIPYRFKPLKFGLICWIHIAPYKTHACNPKKRKVTKTQLTLHYVHTYLLQSSNPLKYDFVNDSVNKATQLMKTLNFIDTM
jgi:hypothetical protein